MSNALTTQAPAGLLALTDDDLDNLAGSAKIIGAEYNVGSAYMKFSGNDGSYSTQDQPIEHGSVFIVDVLGFKRGWVCWKDEKLVERVQVSCWPHEPLPPQSSLTDHGPYAKRPDGKPAGGWVEEFSGLFTDPASGEVYKFNTSSRGGVRAMAGLWQEFAKKQKMFRDEHGQPKLPIVEIGANSFKVAGAGTKYAPTFRIVDWMDRSEYNTLAPSGETEAVEEQVEEVVEKAPPQRADARTAPAKPAPVPQTKRVGGSYKDTRSGLK